MERNKALNDRSHDFCAIYRCRSQLFGVNFACFARPVSGENVKDKRNLRRSEKRTLNASLSQIATFFIRRQMKKCSACLQPDRFFISEESKKKKHGRLRRLVLCVDSLNFHSLPRFPLT